MSKHIQVVIGGRRYVAAIPALVVERGRAPVVVAPAVQGVPLKRGSGAVPAGYDHETGIEWGGVTSYHGATGRPTHVWLSAFALIGAMPASELSYSTFTRGIGTVEGEPVDVLFSSIDGWLDSMFTWVAVLVGQDTHYAEPLPRTKVPAEGLTLSTVFANGATSLPRSSRVSQVMADRIPAVTYKDLRRACSLASDGTDASTSRLVLRDGQIDLRRGRFRKAVIDGGTAAEVALATWVQAHGIHLNTKKPTLGAYVLKSGAPVPSGTMTDLVDLRNAAIHQSVQPTREQARRALEVAATILDTLEPMKF